jgi:glucosyl-3-phosphoglycerate synthase
MSQRTTPTNNHVGTYLVLLPVLDDEITKRMLPLANAIAARHNGSVALLKVVLANGDLPLGDNLPEMRRARAELEALIGDTALVSGVQPLVQIAHDITDGIRRAVETQKASLALLGWQADQSSSERLFGPPIGDLLRKPPCDTVVIRLSEAERWERLLLPVRGGPHTSLASDLSLALAEHYDAAITILYAIEANQSDEQHARESLQPLRTMPRVSRWLERAIPVETAILSEAADHQAIVIGVTGRRDDAEAPGGPLADRILRRTNNTLVLVSRRMSDAEIRAQQAWQQQRDRSALVDRWFVENTFTSSEFEDLTRLVTLKQQQQLTISLGLPALNEEATIGEIIDQVKRTLMVETPLLDEIVLIDSRSTDRTREIAQERGIPVYIHQDILPQYGEFYGKGEALWKSLHVLNGDLVVWVDTDIKNFHPRFIYGVVGPLLRNPRLMYCKGFYQRPLQFGEAVAATGGGRVTELTARPLLNLFYPELSGLLQPLSGEYAARREAVEWAPFFTGYGVEIGLLIDLLEHHGINALAQVDLHERIHRNQELVPLSKMAFAITQVVMQRLEQRQRVQLVEPINQTMKLIRAVEEGGYHLELREIRDHERPPIATLPEYRRQRGVLARSGPRTGQ